MAAETQGTELLRQIHEGGLVQRPSRFLTKTRAEITEALGELLDVGARIHPLLIGTQQVGWVRGVHLSERKALRRWSYDDLSLVERLLRGGDHPYA